MNIIWHYLDKRGAAINALKDYGSMQYIIDHTDEEIDTIHDKMSSVGSPVLSDLPTGPPSSVISAQPNSVTADKTAAHSISIFFFICTLDVFNSGIF